MPSITAARPCTPTPPRTRGCSGNPTPLGQAFAEYGRIDKTLHLLGILDPIDDTYHRKVKNRVHVDLATTSAAHQADLVARLMALGATPADVGQGNVPWTILADPEGNEFDVLTPR